MVLDLHLHWTQVGCGDNQARPTVIDSRSILAGVQGFESLSPHKINLLIIVLKEFYFIITGKFSLSNLFRGCHSWIPPPAESQLHWARSASRLYPFHLMTIMKEKHHKLSGRENVAKAALKQKLQRGDDPALCDCTGQNPKSLYSMSHLRVSCQCIKIYSTK